MSDLFSKVMTPECSDLLERQKTLLVVCILSQIMNRHMLQVGVFCRKRRVG